MCLFSLYPHSIQVDLLEQLLAHALVELQTPHKQTLTKLDYKVIPESKEASKTSRNL